MKKISPHGRLRLKKIIRLLLGKLGIALLADFDLGPVDFPLIKALDRSPLANRTFCSTIVELVSDSRSPMCFGHSILLIEIGFLETISNSLSARQGIEHTFKKTGAQLPHIQSIFPSSPSSGQSWHPHFGVTSSTSASTACLRASCLWQ